MQDRRKFVAQSLATLASIGLNGAAATAVDNAEERDNSAAMTLGFSTYGMKSLPTEDAISTIARIGFDAVELTVWPEWDAAPDNMPQKRRAAIKTQLQNKAVVLSSLMEHVIPTNSDAEHQQHLTRLRRVFDLALDLGGAVPPVVQTVLGGGRWSEKRSLLRDRVGDWLELAARQQLVLAVKPHRGGVMSKPSEAVWLIEQLGYPKSLRIVYDYSHYAYRDLSMEATVATALPYLAHVAVKDAVKNGDRVAFVLPGAAGTIPYGRLLRMLQDGGYRGDINCEVSGMVWKQNGYDPVAAAEQCYNALAKAFREAGISRSRISSQ